MPVPMDALTAFAYLSDNLPAWITSLSDLTAHTSAKHAEFADAFRKHSTPYKPRRRKNSSVCSIQTGSARSGSPKRRRGSRSGSGSDNSSFDTNDGPAVISTRHSLVIHYDGHTQKILEDMVRNIGTARNNLRKGKMAQIPMGGVRSPRSGARALLPSLDSAPGPEGDMDIMASIRSTRRGPPTNMNTNTTPTRQSPFDIADKNLELAYSFCETAAYSFLRAGGCESELESVKDRFAVLLRIAAEEVQILEKEKKEKQGDEEKPPEEEAKETAPPVSLKRPASSEDLIEVDDEQVSVESIDLSAFRVGRMRR